MGKAASVAFTLGAGLLVTVLGLALKLNILIVLTVALLAAGCVFYFFDFRARPDRRVFLQVTPEQVRQIYDGRTTLQGEKAAEIYVGKWMKVSGTVRDVVALKRSRAMWLKERNTPVLIFNSKLSRLDVIHKGDAVTVVGRVFGVSKELIQLNKCELVSSETPKDVGERASA